MADYLMSFCRGRSRKFLLKGLFKAQNTVSCEGMLPRNFSALVLVIALIIIFGVACVNCPFNLLLQRTVPHSPSLARVDEW